METSKVTKPNTGNKRKRESGTPHSLLDRLPRRNSTLCQHALVANLSPPLLAEIREWLLSSFPGSPEIATCLLDYVAVTQPTHLRVKELFETVEAAKHAGSHINQLDPKPGTIYDLACGHGLGGVLLGYRFPSINVVCVDRQQRKCFATYMEAFKIHGEGKDLAENVTFVEGEVEEGNTIAGTVVEDNSYHLCIHGCNEMSTIALEIAKRTHSGYTIVPCCIRESCFGVRTKSAYNRWKMSDDVRYAVQVGYLGGQVHCDRIACIDRRITNRNLVIIGDFKKNEESSTSTKGQDVGK